MRQRSYVAWVVFLVFLPAFALHDHADDGFVADDFFYVTESSPISPLALLTFHWGHTEGDPARYRPLVGFSYEINKAIGGREPTSFHIFNFLLHGAVAATLARITTAVSGSLMAGAIAGLLFAIHPTTHENVLWVSGRTHPLAALFYLFGLLWLASRRGRAWTFRHGLALICFWLSLSSYETAVSFPLAVLLLAVMYPEDPSRPWWRALPIEVGPYLLMLVAYLLFRTLVLHSNESSAVAASASLLLANLTRLTERALACGPCALGGSPISSLTFWITLVTVIAAAAVLWRSSRRVLTFGVGLFVIAFLPFLTFPGFADRFAYLSLAGLTMVMGAGIASLLERLNFPRAKAQGDVSRAATLGYVSFLPPLAGGTLLVLVVLLWGRQLRLAAQDWGEASAIASTIVKQTVKLLPNPPIGATLHFFRVPLAHKTAYVFITSFDVALRTAYQRKDINMIFDHESSDAAIAEAMARRGKPIIFWWDANADTLHCSCP